MAYFGKEIFMSMVLFLLASIMLAFPAAAQSAPVNLQFALNWKAEPEFGGFYAAKLSGYFEKRGLNVGITEGGAGTPVVQMVANSKVPFGIAASDEVAIAQARGADVIALFAVYQTNPQGIMVHKSRGLKEIADVFKGPTTLAVEPGLPYVNFLKHKYDFSKVKLVAYDGGIGTFVADPNFAQQCFVTSEPIAAKKLGSDPQVFLVADAGYNPYTAVVITTGKRIKDRPDEIKRTVEALQEGWRAYLDDPKPANAAMRKLNPDMDAATFAAAADAQEPLIETEETKKNGLGSMTKQRWQTLIQQLVDLKVVKNPPSAEECFR